jgi:hypothetical protein
MMGLMGLMGGGTGGTDGTDEEVGRRMEEIKCRKY